MIVRYRYRFYPTAGQEQMLARTFGCARVVFNDAVRLREESYRAGEKLSDAEVQRRVVTLAKRTAERAWLGEVASVVLVQACRDARRAYRNWFESLSGTRKGRQTGRPRLRRRASRQSVRFTRNGFAVRDNGRVYLAKIGEVRVRWSRDLPSEPSSVTVIREPDGRYYLSFVVEREAQPLPLITAQTGIDLGLDRLAVTSDGEIIENRGSCGGGSGSWRTSSGRHPAKSKDRSTAARPTPRSPYSTGRCGTHGSTTHTRSRFG